MESVNLEEELARTAQELRRVTRERDRLLEHNSELRAALAKYAKIDDELVPRRPSAVK